MPDRGKGIDKQGAGHNQILESKLEPEVLHGRDYSTAEIGAIDQQFPRCPFTKTESLRITPGKLGYRVLRAGRIYSNKSKH